MACSATVANCPAIVTSCSRLAYCRIVACCTGTVAALIESPRWPDSFPATGHSLSWWVAVGHRIARPRCRPLHPLRASRFVPRSTANARPRRQNNSDPEPFPAPLSVLDIHTDGPAAAPRSWLGFPIVSLGVASAPPKNDRSSPASALGPAIAPTGSSPPKLLASSSAHPGSAPGSGSSAVGRNNGRASPRNVLGARSPRTPSAPWLALPCLPERGPNRNWSAPAHIRSHSPAENVPTLDRSLPPPGPADVLAPASSRRLPSACARRSFAPRPASILPASGGSGPPSWPPVAPAPCDSGENILLLLPLHPSRALLPEYRTPTQNPNAIGRR